MKFTSSSARTGWCADPGGVTRKGIQDTGGAGEAYCREQPWLLPPTTAPRHYMRLLRLRFILAAAVAAWFVVVPASPGPGGWAVTASEYLPTLLEWLARR